MILKKSVWRHFIFFPSQFNISIFQIFFPFYEKKLDIESFSFQIKKKVKPINNIGYAEIFFLPWKTSSALFRDIYVSISLHEYLNDSPQNRSIVPDPKYLEEKIHFNVWIWGLYSHAEIKSGNFSIWYWFLSLCFFFYPIYWISFDEINYGDSSIFFMWLLIPRISSGDKECSTIGRACIIHFSSAGFQS